MMQLKRLSIATLGLLLLSTEALAAKSIDDCTAKMPNIEEYSMCLDRVKDVTDRELQTWINNQTFELEELATKTGRHSPLDMFKRSQRNFLDYRENNCRWQYLASSPSSKAASIYKMCHILMSKNRIKELSIPQPKAETPKETPEK